MAKRKVVWSSEAKIEFFEILDYYYQRNGNANYSKKLNQTIRQTTIRLKKTPYIGKKTNIENIRLLIEGNFLLFYSIHDTEIRILSIVDSRRNPEVIRYKK